MHCGMHAPPLCCRLPESSSKFRTLPLHAKTYVHKVPAESRGWRNTVGDLIELLWLNKNMLQALIYRYMRKHIGGVQFHRIQDFKEYYFNSILPTSPKGALQSISSAL